MSDNDAMKVWQALGYIEMALETALALLGTREKAAQAEIQKALAKIQSLTSTTDGGHDDTP